MMFYRKHSKSNCVVLKIKSEELQLRTIEIEGIIDQLGKNEFLLLRKNHIGYNYTAIKGEEVDFISMEDTSELGSFDLQNMSIDSYIITSTD